MTIKRVAKIKNSFIIKSYLRFENFIFKTITLIKHIGGENYD